MDNSILQSTIMITFRSLVLEDYTLSHRTIYPSHHLLKIRNNIITVHILLSAELTLCLLKGVSSEREALRPACCPSLYCFTLPKPPKINAKRPGIGHLLSIFIHTYFLPDKLFKGTVSQELRPMLLYIIQKLFSRPIIASHKVYILLKGQSAINKKPFSIS